MLGPVVIVREDNDGEIDRAAQDVDQLECIYEGFVEAFDIVILGCAENGGKGRLGLRQEIFCVLGGGRGSDDEGNK